MADLNIRGVDEGILRKLKAEAAIQGVTLRDFVVESLKRHISSSKGEDGERRVPGSVERPKRSSMTTKPAGPTVQWAAKQADSVKAPSAHGKVGTFGASRSAVKGVLVPCVPRGGRSGGRVSHGREPAEEGEAVTYCQHGRGSIDCPECWKNRFVFYAPFRCPCGFVMVNHDLYLTPTDKPNKKLPPYAQCANPACPNYEKKWKLPTVELEAYEP